MASQTVRGMRDAIQLKKIAPAALLEDHCRRVREENETLGTFLSYDSPDHRAKTGPLAGIPFAAKDNLVTATLPTTCGSLMMKDYRAPYTATAIERLTRAGATLIGKTNLDEFSMGSSTEHSAFYPTCNPWDQDRVPGGSSGGSAAAVASGQVPFALGSDTGGSIRQPASFCGVVGMKPSYGAVSRYGLVAFASSMDQVGPLVRDVRDCALILDILIAKDEKDSTSVSHPDAEGFYEAVTQCPDHLQGVRIGVPDEFLGAGVDREVRGLVEEAAQNFRSLGAEVERCSLPHTNLALPVYYLMASAEASSNLARFDGIRYGARVSGERVFDVYQRSRGQGFGPEVRRRILLGTHVLSAGFYDAYYLKAARVRQQIAFELNEAFESFDLLLTPTTPTPAFKRGQHLDDPMEMYMADVCTIPANLAGIPAISLPGGFVRGLPVGIQLMGPRFGEIKILKAAEVFQRATDYHENQPAGRREGSR